MTDEACAEIRHESVGRQGYPRVTLLQSHSGEWWRIETRRGRKLDVPHGERAPPTSLRRHAGFSRAWSWRGVSLKPAETVCALMLLVKFMTRG